ncbi:MAG TPA: hemolysin family protein [Anaerohalosphaeraceae bacterium]|nr:hemolysin family protein [Anaerohalosphaeraceae bacterium]HRT51005.1 hemolysin family protein [Anaerohalosphaeraceae bacterium]HRT86991.1 hemolysin family protein [Anaerohalosphaeraceae bacterium]
MDDVGWSVLALTALTGVSLFYALNNLALRSYSYVKLQDAFKAHNRESRLDRFVEKNEQMIITCSLLRLIANTGILGVLAHLMIIEGLGFIWFFILAVLILSVFSFAVPYSWAKYMCENILVHTYRLLEFSAWVAAPVLRLLSLHDRLVRRLAGVAESSPEEEQEEKQEEILSFVEQSRMEGVVDEEELAMIENVLELSNTTAGEIMTPRTDVQAIEVHTDLPTVVQMIAAAGHSRIPVYEGNIDNIIGLVYAKDLLTEIGRNHEGFSLRNKIRKAYFVPETKPLRVLLHEFQNQKLHIAIVLDEYGGTAGIVTIEDILEELVGEIVDEYEETPPEAMRKIDATTIEIDARMYVDDLNEEFDIELPEDEDYDTVGGFVFSHLGYIPKTGETFEYGNINFTVVAAGPRQIQRLRIQKPSPPEKANQ